MRVEYSKKVLNNSGLIVSHDMDGNFMHWDGVQGKKIWDLLLWFPVQLSQSYRRDSDPFL